MKQKLTSRFGRASLLLVATLCASVTLTTTSSSTAQARPHKLAKKFERRLRGVDGIGLIGAKLNMQWASFSAELDNEQDRLLNDPSAMTSFGFGVTLDRAINRYVGVRAEALFQNKNFSHDSPPDYELKNATAKVESETFLDYIEVPVGVLVRLMPGELIQPYTSVGLYGAMLVNASGTQKGYGSNDNPFRPFSFFDYGWYLSAGSYFILAEGAGYLGAELKYSQGLANIADTSLELNKEEPLANQVYTAGNFALSVSYYF